MQACTEATECSQLAHREIATPCQDAVEHRADMAVGEEEHILAHAVHAELGGVDLHLVEIQGCDDVCRAQRAARMPRLAPMHHANDIAAHLRGDSFQFVDSHSIYNLNLLSILAAKLRKNLFQITLVHLVFLPIIVLFRLMHLRWPHTDLLAVLFDFLIPVGFEQRLHAAEFLLFVLFLRSGLRFPRRLFL